MMSSGREFEVTDVAFLLRHAPVAADRGEVGYVIASIKNVKTRGWATITAPTSGAEPLPGYRR
jgi:translation elongation factor EF-4